MTNLIIPPERIKPASGLTMTLMHATVKLSQTQSGTDKNGKPIVTVGSGWLVALPPSTPSETGKAARIVLVTAKHVYDRMAGQNMQIHWRSQTEDGQWQAALADCPIREKSGAPLYLCHPERDIAVMFITPPPQAYVETIEFAALSTDRTWQELEMTPGDELLAFGFPKGLAANKLGFPILRSGRVASFPLWPAKDYPSFLMDFAVFSGNSGGPVIMDDLMRRKNGEQGYHQAGFVAGLLAQQVILTDERLEIGIVLHASFVREAMEILVGLPLDEAGIHQRPIS